MELQKRSFRPPSSLRTSWMSVWVAFSGGGGVQHPSPRRSETSWVSVWVACNGAAEEELPSTKQSENVVEVCLGGMHWRWRNCSIRCPGGPETSVGVVEMSSGVAFVAQAVRERRGCLSGWHAMELQKRSFRRPSSLRTSWMSVWVAFTGGGGVQHPLPRRSGNVVGVCLGGIRCSGSPRTSWVSVWVACNGAAEEELPSTKQSENVVEVCLGGMQWNCRRGASVPQAV